MDDRIVAACPEHALDGRAISDVDLLEVEVGAILKPAQVLLRALAGQIVENRYLPISVAKIPGRITADEARAPRDQHPLAAHLHSSSPTKTKSQRVPHRSRAAFYAVPRKTRISAFCFSSRKLI